LPEEQDQYVLPVQIYYLPVQLNPVSHLYRQNEEAKERFPQTMFVIKVLFKKICD